MLVALLAAGVVAWRRSLPAADGAPAANPHEAMPASPASAPDAPPAEPWPAVEPALLTLQPGMTRHVALPAGVTAPLRLRVIEQGVDIEAELGTGDARIVLSDDDILRWGEHRAAVTDAGSPRSLRLRVPRLGSPTGTVCLVLEPLDAAAAGTAGFALDREETALAQHFAQRSRLREPATAEQAAALCERRLAAQDNVGYVRCVGLQERVLGAQSQRAAAIAAIERALPAWQRIGDPRQLASALNNLGMHHYRSGDGAAALPPLRRALSVLEGFDDTLLRALVQNNICLSGEALENAATTRRCFEDALSLSEASGDGQRIAIALNNLGGAYWLLGDTTRAADLFEQAAARWQSFDDRRGSADPLNNIALVQLGRGRLSDAARGFARAAEVSGDDPFTKARALRNQGAVQLMLGEPALAIDLQQQALALIAATNRPDETVATLSRLAEAQLDEGHADDARASIERAVTEAQAATARPQLAIESQLRAARIYRRGGAPELALAAAQHAYEASASHDRAGLHARARIELGHAQLRSGDAPSAQQHAGAALQSSALTALERVEAQALLAAALRAQGRSAAAEAAYRGAIVAIERAGSYVFDLEQRAVFLASQRDAQVGLIALLMQDVDAQGRPRRAADALMLSASFRARSLRSRLDAMPLPVATDPAAASQRERVLDQLAALALTRWKQQETLSDERRRRIDADIRRAEAELRSLDVADGSEPAAAAPPQLAQLQQALPPDTSLVVFRTLPQTSYAWVVGPTTLQTAALGSEDELAALVRAARAALGADGGAATGDWQQRLATACERIWQPIARWVDTERVLVVSDAALDGLPFAALRCGEDAGYLLQRHEIALLPAPWLLLRTPARDLPEDFRALLVGDPVYTRDDPRLGGTAASTAPRVVLRGTTDRLRGSGEEIRRVRGHLGDARSTLRTGFEASLGVLQRDGMDKYSILHFATHGTSDERGASGSGLVLSLFDADGRETDGFLSARRIGASRVPAALVVLGACDSASGRAVQDEGTFGVAYAFLQAGARHVVATLWPVDDDAMPALMDRFYADPRVAAQRPAKALRQAQLALLARYPAASPALWAGVAVWGW